MTDQITQNSNEEVSFDKLQQELSSALQQAEENLSGWKRAQADLENYRKRKDQEGAELLHFGKTAAFVQILPVLDSLEQALLHSPEIADSKYENWKKGLDGIVNQINSTMEAAGIKKVEAIGKKFDPNLHEAVREVPGETDGIIAEQYQTGYLLDGKLLRPAQVAITKKY